MAELSSAIDKSVSDKMSVMGSGNSQSTESAPASQVGADVPTEFKRFVDPATGKVDMHKAATSYREAEQNIARTAEEKATIQRAYDEVIKQSRPAGEGASPNRATGRKVSIEEFVQDPDATTRSVVRDETSAVAGPIVQAVLSLAHPEVALNAEGRFSNPEFVNGLTEFAKTLPPEIRQSMASGNFASANWVIQLYKDLKKGTATNSNSQTKTPFAESAKAPASAEQATGKVWKRSELRTMSVREPVKYSQLQDEISKAYEEGRVDLDH